LDPRFRTIADLCAITISNMPDAAWITGDPAPLKSALSFFGLTAGRSKGECVSSVIVAVALR